MKGRRSQPERKPIVEIKIFPPAWMNPQQSLSYRTLVLRRSQELVRELEELGKER